MAQGCAVYTNCEQLVFMFEVNLGVFDIWRRNLFYSVEIRNNTHHYLT
jgi:hypothetical protein